MDKDFLKLLNCRCAWSKFEMVNVYGEHQYFRVVLLDCYKTNKTQNITNDKGAIVVSKMQVIVDGICEIGVQDQIDGYDVITIIEHYDDTGKKFHTTVYM